jgi:transglutaminase-like putative cysteine protease
MLLVRPDTGTTKEVLLIRGGYTIAYECADYTPMVFTIHIRPERSADLVKPEKLTLTPPVAYTHYHDTFGNFCTRLIAPPGRLSITNQFVIADSGKPEELPLDAWQHQVAELPDETLLYLMGSRYCDTQKLGTLAWEKFGKCFRGYPLVQAILDYTHERLTFDYARARDDRTAFEAHEERTGVCRDFAHLAITLFRCMNVPARYCTGYLGDIGVPADPAPMDFSACMEVYMGGRWWTLDPRHNSPRIGRILMARGRDAADVAISTAFGDAKLVEFRVTTEAV